MGEMGRATCMICGAELPIEQMERSFTGRPKYRCFKCVADGEKQVMARISESYIHGRGKRMKERDEWR